MCLQLELFPDYPRLPALPAIAVPDRWWGAWRAFDFPESDNKPMAENPEHANTIANAKNAIEMILAKLPRSFAAVDTFMYILLEKKDKKGNSTFIRDRLAPDVMLAYEVADLLPEEERASFNLPIEKERLILEYQKKNPDAEPMKVEDVHINMLTIEVMSPSNYRNKKDQHKRWQFYQNAGVQEYLVIHTRSAENRKKKELSLEFYVRQNGYLTRIIDLAEHTSHVAGLCFGIENDALIIKDLEGNVFLEYVQEVLLRKKAEAKLTEAEAKVKAEENARKKAEKQVLAERKARERAEEEAKEEARTNAELLAELAELRKALANAGLVETVFAKL
jgi:Putative restriction endonuclease